MANYYEIKGTKRIIDAGDTVNEAVNQWVDAVNSVDGAWLAFGALGKYGAPAEAAYRMAHSECMAKLHAANRDLISLREALYQAAGLYAKADVEATERAKGIERRMHRPEIDDSKYD
ncbi:type VII secretion target [Actinomadura hibisca]|uniref:type VII secretion target n=1 Tax=Actinomadura hibisca TaxID=68565 RepID=UPI000A032357|nr:type VII secretion target [Actinomadura hibisca]